jgi:hypothetical protein
MPSVSLVITIDGGTLVYVSFRLFLLTREGDMAKQKPLKPDDFPVEVKVDKLVTADGKPIGKAETPVIAEDVAERLNVDDFCKEQDRWSA